MPNLNCTLCGLKNPRPPIESDGYSFCCFGCKEVYRIFGPKVFEQSINQIPKSNPREVDGVEAFLRVEGMHCSSCEILIERIAEKINGVFAVSSSYATSTAKVNYDPDAISES